MSAFTVLDPFDLPTAASEIHSALRLRARLLGAALRAQTGCRAAPDVWNLSGKLHEWRTSVVRVDWRGGEEVVRYSGGEPVLITPERLEELVAETVTLVEADPKRSARDDDAQALLRCWIAWGRRLPPSMAAQALKRAEVRGGAHPELRRGRVS